MELLSITLARAALLFEVDSLDPFGKMSAAESVIQIRDRYGFAFTPERSKQTAPDKGAEFSSGRMGETVIDKLTLFSNGIVVDTRSSTDAAEAVAADIMSAAKDLLGSKVVVERRYVVSQVTFRSNMKLATINAVLDEICSEVERYLSANLRQQFVAEPTAILINTDTTQTQFSPAKFTIERRAEAPFFENIYFSSAPLPTSLHLALVEKFEKSIL